MSLVVKSNSLAKLTFVLEALHSLLFPLQWNGWWWCSLSGSRLRPLRVVLLFLC